MCQAGSAKLNQFMLALGTRSPRPTSETLAKATAKLIKAQWVKNPQHLAAVHLGDSTNELRSLISREKDHPDETKIACAIVQELCQDPPAELIENTEFKMIQYELTQAIGKSPKDFQ